MDPINQNQNPMSQMSQPSAHSKKGLYVVIGVLALIILGFIAYTLFGTTRTVTVGGMNGQITKKLDGSTTYTSDYGTLTTGSNKLPSNWPSDAPAYANASITAAMALDPKYSGTTGSTVSFTTSDSLQSVIDFYKNDLVAKGWTIIGTNATLGATTIISAHKDTRAFSAVITNGSKISVAVSISSMPAALNAALNTQASVPVTVPTTPTVPAAEQSKSILSSMRPQAELYYTSNNNSYKGFCTSKTKEGAYVLAVKLPQGSVYKCNDVSGAWAAGVAMGAGAWCVDAEFSGATAAVPKTTSCK